MWIRRVEECTLPRRKLRPQQLPSCRQKAVYPSASSMGKPDSDDRSGPAADFCSATRGAPHKSCALPKLAFFCLESRAAIGLSTNSGLCDIESADEVVIALPVLVAAQTAAGADDTSPTNDTGASSCRIIAKSRLS